MAIFRDLTGLTLRALQSQLVEGGIGPDDFNRIKAEFLRRGYSQAEFDALRAATYAAFDDGKPVPVINPPGSASITGPVGGPATGPPPPPPPPSPSLVQPTGAGRTLPFMARHGTAALPSEINAHIQASVRESAEVLKLANLSVPKLRDVARYEASFLSRETLRKMK